MSDEKDFDLLKEIKDRFKLAYDYWDGQYNTSLDDLRFFENENDTYQWPQDLRAERESDFRPCLTINKLPTFVDQVIGDIRQNEPWIKIKAVDSKADPKTAEILTGLIYNIQVQNDAETVYDTAVESAAICGVGAFRIGTAYTEEDRFEQDITMQRIKNPFTVYWDPGAEKWDKSDAKYCFITEKISKEEFKRQYGDEAIMPFEGGKDNNPYWGNDKQIRVAEYFKVEPIKKTIYLVQKVDVATGQGGEIYITDMKPDPNRLGPEWKVIKERRVETHKLIWAKASQDSILEGPQDWPGKYIPIVMVYGKETNIEGKTYYRGIVRHAKDPMRLYNYSRSTGAEVTSLAPKAPYLVTANQIGNYQKIWDTAHKKSYPYLPYVVDKDNPQAIPKRAEPISVNTGIQAEVIIADQEIHDTTGLQLASLGKKSNEKSGRAIIARQREGDVANFAFYDNLARAVRYAGKVIVDLIPKIYDTPRIVRILNRDGADKFVAVNQAFRDQDGMEKIYDLTMGKYDAVVSIGPAYTTQREETAENMMRFVEGIPAAGPLIGDLIAKNMDWPGADEIERRLKILLPPQLQQQEGGNGGPVAPPQPYPMQMLQFKGAVADVVGKELDNKKKYFEAKKASMPEKEKEEGKSASEKR